MQVYVDGPALIRIVAPGGSLEDLGYTENGVDINEVPHEADVYGDQNGGDQGEPIDVQRFGETHTIRMLLTKWDEDVLNKIRKATEAATVGIPVAGGTLLRQGGHEFRLLIQSTSRPRNYVSVLFREPREINKGTKHSKALIVATAYRNLSTGVLYNTTTS